ncbi:MAG: succinylglutamate desuccinylase/aspartoacylase family protein [Planctomycetaceae bacterium]|nr:succinylglutamate desuccinylase/aspartoacylase family protein [Planctomycetaceae bacterium]
MFQRKLLTIALVALLPGCALWGRPMQFPGAAPQQQSAPAYDGTSSPDSSGETRTNRMEQPGSSNTPAQDKNGGTTNSDEVGDTPIEQRSNRIPLEVPDPIVDPMTNDSPAPQGETREDVVPRNDLWKTTPDERAEPPAQVKPLDPPGRRPAPQNPAGIELGEPAPFPTLPERNDANMQDEQYFRDEKPVASRINSISDEKPVTTANALAPADWKLTLRTTGKRPLQVARAGTGNQRVFITGSLSGLETESVALIDNVFAQLQSTAPSASTLFLLRTPNPDGIAEHTRTNLKGVDLNRNFPSTRFTAVPTQQTGPHPGSEVETQHVMQLLREFEPKRVIHVRSSIGHRPLVLMNEPAAQTFAKLDLPKNADYAVYTGDFKAGSLEEFCALRMGVETITILLPVDGFDTFSANELLTFATSQTTVVSHNQGTQQVRRTDQGPLPDGTPKPDGDLGFVDTLPPPPHVSEHAEKSDPRYYELPPPPHLLIQEH